MATLPGAEEELLALEVQAIQFATVAPVTLYSFILQLDDFIATLFISFYFWLCSVFSSCEGFLQLQQVGATPHRGAGTALHRSARAFHYRGPSRRGAQAPDAQAQ